jgi:hypothetical protein
MKQVVGGTARMMGTAKTFTYNDPNRKNTVGSTGCMETSHKQQERTWTTTLLLLCSHVTENILIHSNPKMTQRIDHLNYLSNRRSAPLHMQLRAMQ